MGKLNIAIMITFAFGFSRAFLAPQLRSNHHHSRAFNRLVGLEVQTRMYMTGEEVESNSSTPITLLAGFLGSGKTSTLQHILQNKEGLRVGVIVNDMASVNIDSKLVSASSSFNPSEKDGKLNILDEDDTIELQNGCACCSLADELLDSVNNLISNGRKFDSIVVELSGVADPVAVRDNWKQVTEMNVHPATKKAQVSRVVTVVDSSTFGTDWMTWDIAYDRDEWVEEGDDCSGQRKVPELLAEQVEAADVLLINKADLAGEEQVVIASSLATGLNDKAEVYVSEFGRIPLAQVLGLTTKNDNEMHGDSNDSDHSHSHDHSHSDEKDEASHNHLHDHEHSASCSDPTCTDPTHDHSHSHEHSASCSDPTCTDPTHDHSHSHEHSASCSDPTCTDPTHDHSHSHDHASTAADNLGITSFVYRKSTPFDTNRLLGLLNKWPVPIKDTLDIGELKEAAREGYAMGTRKEHSPFVGVLRSKGFCWLSPTNWSGPNDDIWRHDTAMYWSHAGKHFGVTTAGKWWGSITKEQMKGYFTNNMSEYDRILAEDWASDEWGDRRQEIVFIGVNLDESAINLALDECLCNEEEMKLYNQKLRNFVDTTFTSPAIGEGGPSLFDATGNDHMDL